jgi:glycosyltransferase involved in cell wall biosynthesis
MKIVFLTYSDIQGGAARATYWLANGLINSGHDVRMIVYSKSTDHYWVNKIGKTLQYNIRLFLDSIPIRFYKLNRIHHWSINLIENKCLYKEINKINPDIINIHWVGNSFMPISLLKKIKQPIVWSLYDMWPFTGGCHYDNFCNKFKTQCGTCPQLKSSNYDLSRFLVLKKEKEWRHKNITIVSPSNWLNNLAKESLVFKNHNFKIIPHGTDLKIFRPIDKITARKILNLPIEGNYILFGSMAGVIDKRKGYQFLIPALDFIKKTCINSDLKILIFGQDKPLDEAILPFETHYIGKINDDITLALLYSASSLTITPSMQEAFGMTASESMACGTPVVAFGATGPLDVIDHKENGYLATPYDFMDLASGILWVLDPINYNRISKNARQKCLDKFDLKDTSNAYFSLYSEKLKNL